MLTIACSLIGKAAEGDTYTLVTDASELKSGDIVVIASKDKAVAMGAPNDKKEKYQPVTGIKITDDVLAYKEGFTELLLEGEAGKWYFKYGNGYIYAKSTTSTVLSFDTNKKKSANISISNGNASIGFDIVANSKYLSYSTKTSNFGYYNGSESIIWGDYGVSVQIYKKQRRDNGLSISTKSVTTTTADLDGNFHSYVTLTNPNNLSPITYKSSNTGVAEVNEQGEVKVNKSGETTITVSYAGNDTYTQAELSYTLTINKLENGITIDKTSVAADFNGNSNEAKQYVPLINPNSLPVTYTSSNSYVARVDENGNVTLNSWGTTTITATFAGNDKYTQGAASYELNVNNVVENIDFKVIEFVAGKDKGHTSILNGSTQSDEMAKYGAKIHSGLASFATDKYHINGRGSSTDITVENGKIIRIEMVGSDMNRLQGTSEGNYKIESDKIIWTGNSQKVSFKNSHTVGIYAAPTSIKIYVDYHVIDLAEESANDLKTLDNTYVKLNRTLVADKWNTLCVPFAISEEEIKANFGEGTLVEKFEAVNGNTVNFANATSIEAGVPYLIKPTVAGTTYTFNGKEVSADAPKTEGNADVTFKGIYSPTDITKNGTVKAAGVTEGGKVLFVNPGSQTKAFRCFFTISENASITPAMLKISIKGVETAINSIVMDNSNATDNAVYNLQGQRVNGNSLTKGIYIKNGKKFAVK
ncbi:Ig-like domain-containing protein [uncultured Prevotella sp.]|uniref:Ig-like domain-containing protein n=1 Tax=uncultured Prevotella sp. TaxID=159272 RepID=UPI00349FBDCF